MRKIVVFFLFFAIFFTLSAWDEFNQYSIADELRKPGVKLVAVDFYATWCVPCNEAIPKWKKLQEKYGDKGFKLIVVSVQSEGSCSQPPQWNPDKIVCDYDGDIADAWHANDLPQAFLWSWQGNLLVAHGGVDNVATAVENYFKKIPRVYVEEGNDKNIYQLVRSKLRENSKIDIVASDEERKALAELRKKSANLNYDQKMQCKLGEEISANSRLVISKQQRGKKDALVLELFSVEKGCLTASGTATMRGNPEQEVAEAVYNLLKNLLDSVSMPGEGGKQVKEQKQTKKNTDLEDLIACEKARSESSNAAWKGYLAKYPSGECAGEAKDELDKIDKKACKTAAKKNSFYGWQEYLKEFPNGQCATAVQNELNKIDSNACEQAKKQNSEGRWKDYLKQFPDGKCKAEANKALDEIKAKIDRTACEKAEKRNSNDGWKDYLQKFPNGKCIEEAKNFFADEISKKDIAACEKAREKSNKKSWNKYLEEWPEGQCANEASNALDSIACKEAENDDSMKGWKEYLDKFPNGKCAVQAKDYLKNQENIDNLYKKGRNMKIAGAVLLSVGAVVFIAGMGAGGYYERKAIRESTDGDNAYRAGLLYSIFGPIGGVMMGTGIPLVIIGVKKEKEAKSYIEINNLAVVPKKDGFYASFGFNF